MIELSVESITGNRYLRLMEYANASCQKASAVFERAEDGGFVCAEAFDALYGCVLERRPVTAHCFTKSMFTDAEIVTFRTGMELKKVIYLADSISDWNGGTLPEDICFFRDGKLWLCYISHERLLTVDNETKEDVVLLEGLNRL
ncbi:MAG: hypothetical protein IJR90_06175 [Clostridia bacterium]|nr:hypothetical protein [Clostridia bacterium]